MSRLFCRSREDVQSSWKAALTSIELRCQLIFCPASQSSQFPGLFFPPKKSFSFWREIFFAAHDCIFVESSSTMFIDNNNNKKKNFGSKSFARVNSDLFSLISFCPPSFFCSNLWSCDVGNTELSRSRSSLDWKDSILLTETEIEIGSIAEINGLEFILKRLKSSQNC